VGKGAKILSKIGPTKRLREIGKSYAEAPVRIKYAKSVYDEYRKQKSKEENLVKDSRLIDRLNFNIRGRVTNRASEALRSLTIEEQKKMSEDEDEQGQILAQAIKDAEDGKKGADIAIIAAERALKSNNGDDTKLLIPEVAVKTIQNLIRRMGDLTASQKKVIDSKTGEAYLYGEAAEEYERLLFRDNYRSAAMQRASKQAKDLGLDPNSDESAGFIRLTTEKLIDEMSSIDWERERGSIMLDWAKKYQQMSDEDKRDESRKIGNRLYAQKYGLYQYNQDGKIKTDGKGNPLYAEEIITGEGSGARIVAHGIRLDENLNITDGGLYEGSVDAAHEQAYQIWRGELLKRANPVIDDKMILQLARDLGGINVDHNNAGLAMTVKIGVDGRLEWVDLSRQRGRDEHARMVMSKLNNMSPGDAARTHPLSIIVKSKSEKGGVVVNPFRPEYSNAYYNATASNDSRGASGTRNDTVFALGGILDFLGKDIPYTEEEQVEAIRKFNILLHPSYGNNPLPVSSYAIILKKLLNKLGVKNIKSDTNADEYEGLTSLNLTVQKLRQITELIGKKTSKKSEKPKK